MPRNLAPLLLVLMACACAGTRPADLGVRNQRLSACPSSPNCVSSFAADDDPEHFVEPLAYVGDRTTTRERLLAALREMARAEIVTAEEGYIYAEFTSLIWRFVDDVEFLFDDATRQVHCRSASRIGHSDLGVNRERIEAFRADLAAAPE